MSNEIIKSQLQSHRYKHIPVPIMPTYQNSKAAVSRKRPFIRSNISNCQKYSVKEINSQVSEYNKEPVAKQPRLSQDTKHVDKHSCQEFSATADIIMSLYEGTLGQVSPYKILNTECSGINSKKNFYQDMSTPEPPYYCVYLSAQKLLQYDKVSPTRVADRLKLLFSQRIEVNNTPLDSQHDSINRVNSLLSACLLQINKKLNS